MLYLATIFLTDVDITSKNMFYFPFYFFYIVSRATFFLGKKKKIILEILLYILLYISIYNICIMI